MLKKKVSGEAKMKENENRSLANNIWGVVVFEHMGLQLWRTNACQGENPPYS